MSFWGGGSFDEVLAVSFNTENILNSNALRKLGGLPFRLESIPTVSVFGSGDYVSEVMAVDFIIASILIYILCVGEIKEEVVAKHSWRFLVS